MDELQTDKIIIFDGECKFCNDAVNFIIKRDPKSKFSFTPSQSETATSLMERFKIPPQTDSLILITGDNYYLRTDAALKISLELSGPWPLFFLLKFIPREFRDPFYKVFASNRHILFGKKKTCKAPTKSIRNRFIE